MSEAKVYGYVLLPVAFTPGGNETIEQTVERLWEAGGFDLTDTVEHFHEDGGFAPLFVEASNEYEARELIGREEA